MSNSQITEIYHCIFLMSELYLEKEVVIMNRRILMKNENYIIVQHSYYPVMKIHRKNHLTTYDIQKMLSHNKAFDLTNTLFSKKHEKSPGHFYQE